MVVSAIKVYDAGPQVSDFNTHVWKAAHEDFERRMGPIEQRISQKLKELFGKCFAYN